MQNRITENFNSGKDGQMKKNPPLASFFFALSFLTRFSCPMVHPAEKIWHNAVFYFPLIGMILGFTAGFFPMLAAWYLEGLQGVVLFFSIVYVGLLELQSRFLHLDGFCDCCDGFYAMTDSVEKRLAIMKDPHVGSAAVGSAILLISAKVLAVYLLFMRLAIFEEYLLLGLCLIVIPAPARYAMVWAAYGSKYPRENGTGKALIGQISFIKGILLPGMILSSLIFGGFGLLATFRSLFPLIGSGENYLDGFRQIAHLLQKSPSYWQLVFSNGGLVWLLVLLGTYFSVVFWKNKAKNKIGGVTGDVLGAVCETCELMMMIAMLIVADRLTFI